MKNVTTFHKTNKKVYGHGAIYEVKMFGEFHSYVAKKSVKDKSREKRLSKVVQEMGVSEYTPLFRNKDQTWEQFFKENRVTN